MRTSGRSYMAVGRLSVVAAVVLLGGCAEDAPRDIPDAGADEVWVVGIRYPEGDWSACLEDDSVAESLMTLDMPSSRSSATFTPDASERDVRRVVDCLDRSLTAGDVSVGVTAQRD